MARIASKDRLTRFGCLSRAGSQAHGVRVEVLEGPVANMPASGTW